MFLAFLFIAHVHLYIDIKTYPVYPTRKARAMAAQRGVRGACRPKGKGLGEGYVVVPKNTHYGAFAKSAKIAAGVGAGKVLMWREIRSKWSGATAVDMYEGPVLDRHSTNLVNEIRSSTGLRVSPVRPPRLAHMNPIDARPASTVVCVYCDLRRYDERVPFGPE